MNVAENNPLIYIFSFWFFSFLFLKNCEQRQWEDTTGQNKGFWVIIYFHLVWNFADFYVFYRTGKVLKLY